MLPWLAAATGAASPLRGHGAVRRSASTRIDWTCGASDTMLRPSLALGSLRKAVPAVGRTLPPAVPLRFDEVIQ